MYIRHTYSVHYVLAYLAMNAAIIVAWDIVHQMYTHMYSPCSVQYQDVSVHPITLTDRVIQSDLHVIT